MTKIIVKEREENLNCQSPVIDEFPPRINCRFAVDDFHIAGGPTHLSLSHLYLYNVSSFSPLSIFNDI